MSTVIKRAMLVFAALMLVGITTGCDRRTSDVDRGTDQETTLGQTGVAQEPDDNQFAQGSDDEFAQQNQDPNRLNVPPTPVGETPPGVESGSDNAAGMGDQGSLAQNQGSTAEDQGSTADDQGSMAGDQGALAQGDSIDKAREKVAGDLDIPASAVIVSEQDRTTLASAGDDLEREARLTVSTIQNYVGRIDTSGFDQGEREAYSDLNSDISMLNQDLERFSTAVGDQRDDMKSRVEDKLGDIKDNWKKISSKIDFDQPSATGGGPVMDDNAPNQGIHSPDMDNTQTPPAGQPSDQQQMPGSETGGDQNPGGASPGSSGTY